MGGKRRLVFKGSYEIGWGLKNWLVVPGRWQPSGGDGSGSSSGWLQATSSSRSEPDGSGTLQIVDANSKKDLLHHHQQHHHHANSQQPQQHANLNSLNSLNNLNNEQLSLMQQKLQSIQQQQQQPHHGSSKNDQLNIMLQSCAKKKMEAITIINPYQQHQLDPNNQTGKPKCPECGKIYSNNSNLKQHIVNVHTVQTEFISCHICSKPFKTKQYLQIHLLSMHGIRKRKSYPVYQMHQTSISQVITPQQSPQQQQQQSFLSETSERWSDDKPW